MAVLLAELSRGDLDLVFVLLAVLAFGVAIYLTYLGNWVGALVAAIIGVLILLVAR